MSAMTNYLENQLIDHLFRARSFTAPSALYIALHTGDPGETGANNEVSVTDTGYGREQYDPGYTNWLGTGAETTDVDSAGTGGATSNRVQVTMNTPTGGTNWGQCSHFSIWDAATSGNCLWYGSLTAPKTINQGDPAPYFAIGDIDVTLA